MRDNSKGRGEYLAMLLLWASLLVFFGLLSENFFSARTFGALANRVPTLTVVAVGMTLVLVIGGIDLSVGSVLGLAGAAMGVALVTVQLSLPLAIGLAVAVGLLAGSVNGTLSVSLGIPSFIVSLGMLEIARGLAFLLTGSQTKYIGASVEGLARPIDGLGVSPAFLVAVGTVVAGQLLLTRTVFGRYLVAIGTNEAAARLAGIATRGPKIIVFAIMGGLSGVGSVFHTSRLGSADPNAGVGMELSAIAAVVIGGTSLLGGRGSVVASFLGVLNIATLESGLAQIGATEPVKRVVTGSVIMIAVLIDAWRSRLQRGPLPVIKKLFTTGRTSQ